MKEPLLQVEKLRVSYETESGKVKAVRELNFSIKKGETVAIVGESGSGKTAAALSLIGLLPENGKVEGGSILFNGQELVGLIEKDWEKVRGRQISMVFQDPMSALNPVMTIGRQLEETILLKKEAGGRAAVREECLSLLEKVGISEPALRLKQYPHELSGGIRQRILIAIALASKPSLLIADEPTTALDSTIKKQILALLADLKNEMNISILLITHDLAETVMLADKVLVMYAGQAVEFGPAETILNRPQHPYTQALLQAYPRMEQTKSERLLSLAGQPPNAKNLPGGCAFHPRCVWAKETCRERKPVLRVVDGGNGHQVSCSSAKEEKPPLKLLPRGKKTENKAGGGKEAYAAAQPLLEVKNLTKHFPVGGFLAKKLLKAVDGVDVTIRRGEIVALVGESGCGKSTLWKTLVGIYEPTAGTITFSGKTIKKKKDRKIFYQQVGFVFQDSYSSFNPRMSIGESIMEPLRIAGWKVSERKKRVFELLELVGLPPEMYDALPHEMSGGQRQRAAIARAFAVNPKLVILDEPVSSLDVSIQAQIINLLKDIQEKLQVSMLFISHDLPLVKYFADTVIVMHQGKKVEEGNSEELFTNPKHPYTKTLIAAATPWQNPNPNQAHPPKTAPH